MNLASNQSLMPPYVYRCGVPVKLNNKDNGYMLFQTREKTTEKLINGMIIYTYLETEYQFWDRVDKELAIFINELKEQGYEL